MKETITNEICRLLALRPLWKDGFVARQIRSDRLEEFPKHGYKKRYVFPHTILCLPKPGPDGLKLAFRMCGCRNAAQLRQIVLFADSPTIDEFPDQLFFDDELIWHQQQYGRMGQIATTTLAIISGRMYCLAPHSDIVQRISRYREHKTRIEKVFKGWWHMLLNGILNFAQENRIPVVCIPTSELAILNTDRKRNPKPALFDRIYDQYVQQLFDVQKENGWWFIDVSRNKQRVVPVNKIAIKQDRRKILCITHSITNPSSNMEHLREMMVVEKRLGIKATYHVPGSVLGEIKNVLMEDGHCISFHSYDDQTDRMDQLIRCRRIDYRMKGYSPFANKMTPELTDFNLAFHNFEWLAASTRSLHTKAPLLKNGLVRIPIHFDDSKMVYSGWSYADWEKMAIENIHRKDFVSFDLPDSHVRFWLPNFERFLEKISQLGAIKTLNEASTQVILNHSF